MFRRRVVITDPRFAPKRNDLPWLRRRRAPRVAAVEPPKESAPALGDFLAGRSTHHQPEPPRPAPPQAEPAKVAPSGPKPAAAPVSSSLDLDEPAAPPPAPLAASSSTSLDLDEPAPSQPQAAAVAAQHDTKRRRVDERVRNGERFIASPTDPTVTLTPVQSGIGTLTIEAATSDEVGDLRLGCAYELADHFEQTMQMTQGNRFAPPHSKRPVIVGGHDRFERIQLDLRQCRTLQRLVVYAFSEQRQPINWGGTLILTTHGGARIEVPLDVLQGGELAVLVSIYQVRGELVIRAEMQGFFGDVRDAVRAYGFDRISWLDGRTPVE